MDDIIWDYKPFSGFDIFGLYEVLALRQAVFIVEQNCTYLDVDGYDRQAMHLTGRAQDTLVAYARVLPPGVKFEELSIGRVAVAPHARSLGLGRMVMNEAIRQILAAQPGARIYIQAQEYLADTFYRSLGFVRAGQAYDEDGIPHVDMVRADHA